MQYRHCRAVTPCIHTDLGNLGSYRRATAVAHVVQRRFFHPLSKFPGPYVDFITNWWKTYHTYRLDLHEAVLALHHTYGPIVRIGPKDLHFWEPETIFAIYKAERVMQKTEFYNSFTTFNPNLFGTTNSNVSPIWHPNKNERSIDSHAIRRSQLLHRFSITSAREMEPILDRQIQILCNKLDECARTSKLFDLKVC